VIELGAGLRAVVTAGGREARLRDGSGRDVLRYSDLHAVDATGRALPAALEGRAEGLAIRVDVEGAAYPVEIDPMVWIAGATLTASGGAPDDFFGFAVAVSGDTIVVGAPRDGDSAGAAYVFVRSGTTWMQQQKLVSSDLATGDELGYAVALDGDTAVVGAPYRGGSVGEAYVFGRSGTTWTQTQEIMASGGGAKFGYAMALDGDTAVVGSLLGASVYALSGSTWSLQQALLAPGTPGAEFGVALALDGDTAVVGAPVPAGLGTGAAYVYLRSAPPGASRRRSPSRRSRQSAAMASAPRSPSRGTRWSLHRAAEDLPSGRRVP
jgi:FG-GAP repeat